MSGQIPGQVDDGNASQPFDLPQQSDKHFPEQSDSPDAGEEDVIQEPKENVGQESDDGDPGVDNDDNHEDDEEEDIDDYGQPERPSSRLDFSSDDQGDSIMFQRDPRHRASKSPNLSHISEGSNETDRSTNVAQSAGIQLATGREFAYDGLNDSDPDDTQNYETLMSVAETRSHLFDKILARIRDEGLYTKPQALVAAEVAGTMPGQECGHWWNARDLDTRFSRRIEAFRQSNARPRDDGHVLPVEVQNHITEQLQGLSYVVQGDVMHWLAQGLSDDTRWTMRMTDSIDALLRDRPRKAPSSRAPSDGSNTSGPERALPLLDPQRLLKMDREHLVDIILQQDDKRRAELDQFEADLEIATAEANAERDDAEAKLRKLTMVTQELRQAAHTNGLRNLDLEGRPMPVDQDFTGPAKDEIEDVREYADRIEAKLQECNEERENDKEKIRHLRLEIADLNMNLVDAREETRQARVQAEEIRQASLNVEGAEPVEPLSEPELSPASPSEVSSIQDTTGREPPRDTDAELEALRLEHQLELEELRRDCAKEISDLKKDIDDDRRKAQENRHLHLGVDGQPLPGQESSKGFVGSQVIERHESSDERSGDDIFATSVPPRLDSLLYSLWDDEEESVQLIAVADQQQQHQQPDRAEPDCTGEPAPASPVHDGSENGSVERPISQAATTENARLKGSLQELTKVNSTQRRQLNTRDQENEGATARIRQLEGERNALQKALEKTLPHRDALQEQLVDLERVRTGLQQDHAKTREARRQLAADLERIQNTLQLHLAPAQTARDTDQEDVAMAPTTTAALQQRADDLRAANKILQHEMVSEQAAQNTLQQRFDDVDQERTSLQMMVDNDFIVYQNLHNDSNDLSLPNPTSDQALRRMTHERSDAREESITVRFNPENAETALLGADILRERHRALDDSRTALPKEVAAQQPLTDLQRQLRECQDPRAAEGSTPAVDDTEQAVKLVERLLQVINGLRQFTPLASEIANFATVMVEAGRIAPDLLETELGLVAYLAERIVWPDANLNITLEQCRDIQQLTTTLEAWLRSVEAAVDDSVSLSAAIGSLRTAVETRNVLILSERDGSHSSLSAEKGSGWHSSQAGPSLETQSQGARSETGLSEGRPSNASTTSSFNPQERGMLLNVAAQVADQYTHEHPKTPLDEAHKLVITARAADLFLHKVMEEGQPSPYATVEAAPTTTDNGNVGESSSADDHGGNRLDRDRPTYIDPAWLRLHPHHPCNQCVPVLRFPVALSLGDVDPGPCTCCSADTSDVYTAKSRSSRSSGTRSVAFSDKQGADDQDALGFAANDKSPRSILKKPRSIDTIRAKTRSSSGAPPRSPYPHPGWNAAQLRSPRQTQRSQSTSSAGSSLSSPLPSRELSHGVSVPITPVQKFCCEHFDDLKQVCTCEGRCEDHWCCEHWSPTGICKCKGTCHVPCCTHWQQDAKRCTCADSCAEHTAKKCCLCGFMPGVVPNECACDSTCREHAVCEDYRTFKPRELLCMAGCDAFKKDGKCEHAGVCRQSPCDSHPCCTHYTREESRAYCACGKTCSVHVCCSHYLPGFKTCECQATCADHLPVIPKPLRGHFCDVAMVAEAQTTPPDVVAELYYPSGRVFPRQNGQLYDWNQVAQANTDLLRRHNMLGPNGEILVPPRDASTTGMTQRANQFATVSTKGLITSDGKQTSRARSQASLDALVARTTSIAPPAPPGAYQAALRGGSGFRRGARDEGSGISGTRDFGIDKFLPKQVTTGASPAFQGQPTSRDDALPDMPDPGIGRLLSGSLLDFRGAHPNFDGEEADGAKSTRVSPRRAACADGGNAGSGCNCRCRGDKYHVLTGPGGSWAFFTCGRMRGGGAEQPAVADNNEYDDGDDDLDSTRAAAACSSNRSQSSRSEAPSRQSSRHSSQNFRSQVGSRQGSQNAGSQAASRQGSAGAGSQAGAGQGSQNTTSQGESGRSSRQSSARSGNGSTDDRGADKQESDDGSPGDKQTDDDDPTDDAGDGGGGCGGGCSGGWRPPCRHRTNRRPPPTNPWRQIWDFTWLFIRFLTYGQATNLWAILGFAYDFALLNIQNVLHFLHLGQLWRRPLNPNLPRAEIESFARWLLLVWQLTMLIAMGEERRLWLAANSRTAAYIRALQFRNPYPSCGVFPVDYALLEPALGGLSVRLHKLYFRPGVLGSVTSALQMLSYPRVEEVASHAKGVVTKTGSAVSAFVLGVVAAVWGLVMRMLPGWPGVPSVRPGMTDDAVNLETPVIPANPPNLSDPQVVHGGPLLWRFWWDYFWDLVVRTVTGRRKVSHG